MQKQVEYYSTNDKCKSVSFKTALLTGIAPDQGLYLPSTYPVFNEESINGFSGMTYSGIASHLIHPFLQPAISFEQCYELASQAYSFEVPVERVTGRKYILRLDQGPTASFKDFGARLMALLMQFMRQEDQGELIILTATSGDTGSAIANAFYGLDRIKVVILFPEREISEIQRKQMTTLGKNIHVVSVKGKFDDCQAFVKQAFADPDLKKMTLSSANSINIGRLIPQSIYYFYSYSRLREESGEPVIFSVPSGNFGNATACVLAKKMGLPISRIIIVTNRNDSFSTYLQTGVYRKIDPSINCISTAMNVGHPSNLSRLLRFYAGKMDEQGVVIKQPDITTLKKEIFSTSVSDEETKKTIKQAFEEHGIYLEPHGAAGWAGLEHYYEKYGKEIPDNQLAISLETAHPAKFPEVLTEILSQKPGQPSCLRDLQYKKESYDSIHDEYEEFKDYLFSIDSNSEQ